jgi:tetratricopeptide (TPR) repeat protein
MSLARVEGYLRTAAECARAGKEVEAAAALRMALAAASGLADDDVARSLILVARADLALRAGNRAAGADLLKEACDLDAEHGRADGPAVVRLLRAALAAEAAGRRDGARALTDRALAIAPPGLRAEAEAVRTRLTKKGSDPFSRFSAADKASADAAAEKGSDPFGGLQAQLDALVGLENVKEEVRRLVALAQVGKARRDAGMPVGERTRHLVFAGAPGTGKTTVARVLGGMYGALGVVAKGHLVEVTRADLVAGYVGQTAQRVNAVVESALDGVLFVDEAYSLASGGEEDFGREALAELVKRMEDDRERLVVILAGYSAPMQELLSLNPGLRSRVQAVIEFADYTPEQLAEVYARMAEADGWRLDDAAREKAAATIAARHAAKDESWANARTARALFEETLARHALRVTADGVIDREELDHLLAEDIP